MSRVRAILAAMCGGLLGLGLLVAVPAHGGIGVVGTDAAHVADRTAAVVPRTASPAAYGRQAVRATNRHRVRHGQRRLAGSRCLRRFARSHAARMARERRMYHQDLGPILRRCHLSMVGENVAYGYPTGRAVVDQGWMRSAGHRANILRPQYRRVAVAARRGSDGRWYAAQVFGR